jgi:Protein of unknown function, DUF481
MRIFIIATFVASLTSTPVFADDDENHFFAGYEILEMSMNNFKNFAGEIGYRFDSNNEVRLVIMDVNLTERHLSNKYQAHATDNKGNVKGFFKRYEVNYDRFFSQHWYYMANVGWSHDHYQHVLLDENVDNKTTTIGSGIGYKYTNPLGINHLYVNLSYPVRYFFHPIRETKLGDTTVRKHIIVDNLWLFIGYEF